MSLGLLVLVVFAILFVVGWIVGNCQYIFKDNSKHGILVDFAMIIDILLLVVGLGVALTYLFVWMCSVKLW